MATGHPSPLTGAQIDDPLGDYTTQTRLVLGSDATGIADVFGAVTEIVESLGSRYQLVTPSRIGALKDKLVAGKPNERRRLFNVAEDTCATSLDHALNDRPPRPGVTRSAILIAGPNTIGWWQTVLTSSRPQGLDITTLARYDARTLKVWSLTANKFATEDKRSALMGVTGAGQLSSKELSRAPTLSGMNTLAWMRSRSG